MTDKNIEEFIKYAPTDDEGLYYPETDGKPLAKTDLHRVVIYNTYDKLETYYSTQDDAYVSGNLLIYDIPGKTTGIRTVLFLLILWLPVVVGNQSSLGYLKMFH